MNDKQIIEWSVQESKRRIREEIKKDNLIIFFTRVAEELRKHKNPNFYGRISEIFLVLYPYSETNNTKEVFKEIKSKNLISKDGLRLDLREQSYIKNFLKELDENCKLKKQVAKTKVEAILKKLIEKYLPNSNKLIEPYILGKLISSVGGIKKLYKMPSSTIQLIGAEKALFRHISSKRPSPKYGLIYYSTKIKNSENRGKTARQLANKLAIAIRQDYFQNFAQ